MILELIRTHQPVTREDVDAVLLEKLPEVLDSTQKHRKISNLLMQLSHKQRAIENTGSRKKPQWILTENHPAEINKETKDRKQSRASK